ncbi:TIR domain-containing protein [Ensifer sp. P24N7]|uniref:TIR domain-containing protein n=1 Tax=Sinorhizobium sp. P24N7 TaxID=3348358 RepID=UPI0035F39918
MTYDFASLHHADFEELARALAGRALGVRFEAFPAGPDDGIDGRHATADGDIVLQAKHYGRSSFSALKSTMKRERASIDALKPHRYVLVTSTPLTPANKRVLQEIIGPSLLSPGDIIGPDDLNSLLRAHPDIETAHSKLWMGSTAVMESVLASVIQRSGLRSEQPPEPLSALLPKQKRPDGEATAAEESERDVIYIIKSSPRDDEFTLWLAPKLQAEGYRVFADILTLQPGDRWRRQINTALQHRAVKVLVCCRNETLEDDNVQEDIAIAAEVADLVDDARFLIPLRLEAYRKVKGIGDSMAVDFVRGWGEGLVSLLDALKRQKVPRDPKGVTIDPNWEIFRRRGSVPLVEEPERLTSNWLRIAEIPDALLYYEASGALDRSRLQKALDGFAFPAALMGQGFVTFAKPDEIEEAFASAGKFTVKEEIALTTFIESGHQKMKVEKQVASNLIHTMFKKAWIAHCRKLRFIEYLYSNAAGFHVSSDQAQIGQRIPWGKQGDRRSSMLRDVAKGHVWQFGVTAIPAFWPFFHFKLKSRVLFAKDNKTPTGVAIDDPKKQHRLRRTICKGWRNKQWYGRMLAFLEILSSESAFIRLPLSPTASIVLEASPLLFTSPVSTALPDVLDADAEETDLSTLGRPEADEVDDEAA